MYVILSGILTQFQVELGFEMQYYFTYKATGSLKYANKKLIKHSKEVRRKGKENNFFLI
jgi:hypothetical protein